MTEPRRWHFGKRYVAVNRRTGKRKVWWVSHWLIHPCRDLAVPFEVGARVMTAEWVALVTVLVPQLSPPGLPLPNPACAVPVPYHCDPHPAVDPSVPRPGMADLDGGQSPGHRGTDG